MSIPSPLAKQIDEIKTPGTKILVTSLILALIFVTGVSISFVGDLKQELREVKAELKESQKANGVLNKYIIDEKDEENKRLRGREAYTDSVNKISKYLKEKTK